MIRELENPIDLFIYEGVVAMGPIFYRYKITPNMITFSSFASGLLSAYYLYQKKWVASASFYALSYFLDSCDGYVARTYNQVSEFGDWFDHTSDIIVGILLISILLKQNRKRECIIIMIAFLLNIRHVSCRSYLRGDSSQSLDLVRQCFPCENPKRKMRYTKYFGEGTLNFIIFMILLLSR